MNTKNKVENDDQLGLIVHSYNNFLSGMMGYTELALLECDNQQEKQSLNRSLESGYEAVQFGKAILASLGRLQLDIKNYSVIEILPSILKESRHKVNDQTQLSAQLKIATDLIWFKECLLDLIDFVSFFVEKRSIDVTTYISKKDNTLRIKISAGHLTIEEKHTLFLFQPFYSSRKILGTKDLGLAKAKGFFSQMKARLIWQNKQGFSLTIPLL